MIEFPLDDATRGSDLRGLLPLSSRPPVGYLALHLRGVHFASATIWSAFVDWTVCAPLFLPLPWRSATRPR